LWDESGTPIALESLLSAQGVDLTGRALQTVEAVVGGNGTYYLTGIALHNGNNEGYLAVIPEPGTFWFAALPGALVMARILRRGRP
jgi:hypothetical protein